MNEVLDRICAILEENGRQLIDESPIVEFQQNVESMQKNLSGILEEGRVLRLGIVGEVKAGKSSFLNALLFEGKDVLPKAPTPMTAALTRLSYSEQPSAKIVFYSQDDWKGIERMAGRYDEKLNTMYEKYCQDLQDRQKKKFRQQRGEAAPKPSAGKPADQPRSKEKYEQAHQDEMPADWKACKEVCRMALSQGLEVTEYLGEEKVVPLSSLKDYVGSTGRYTPIVKYTEIQMDNPMLRGVEVIDTPGLNDPVISRSKITKKFLKECDAVCLLSYCGQFLGAEDIDFIMSSLPDEGIRKAVLIGSKMDSAILQYPRRDASFKKAYQGTKYNCEHQAKKNISDCKQTAYAADVIEQIEQSLPPVCTSAIAFSTAMKRQNGESLSAEEAHVLQQLSTRFPDFDPSMLMALSSIEDVRVKAFDETVKQKEKIIQEKKQNFLASQKSRFLKDLEEIYIRVSNSRSDLENFDCAQDEEQLKNMRRRLESARIEVKSAFENAATEAQWSVKEIIQEALEEMNNHLRIEVTTSETTKHHSETHGILLWKHTDHWDEIITTHSAEVRDAEENLRRYYSSCLRMVNDGFRHMIKMDALKEGIKRSVMKAFEQDDLDFDEQRILVPLDSALRKLTLHDISLSMGKYSEMLDSKLAGLVSGGTVRNDDIPELKRAQDQVLSAMAEDIQKLVEAQGDQIANRMNEQAALFIDGVVGELEGTHKRLENQIIHKKENLQKYDDLLEELKNAKQALQKVSAENITAQ